MAAEALGAESLPRVLAASSLAVLCWVEQQRPQARGVVALHRQGRPVVAFTYADEATARRTAAAPRLALALAETRSTGRRFEPLVAWGRPRLVEDRDGEVFTDELLDEELRRYPPSRALADTLLLRREHWWYLPRLLVELDVDHVEALPAAGAGDHLLVVADGPDPVVRRCAGLAEQDPAIGHSVDVSSEPPAPPPGPAVVFGQDASFPDLERWGQWHHDGAWDGARFRVDTVPPRVGLPPTPGLLQRWRRQRALERGCRAALES